MTDVNTLDEIEFQHQIALNLARYVSKMAAQKEWIPQHFIPANRPDRSSLDSIIHQFENGTRYYLHADEMAEAFRANGIRVDGNKVYAKRINEPVY